MTSQFLVVDTEPAVQYPTKWDHMETAGPDWPGHVRQGAGVAGMNAIFSFTGTGIQVVGTLERSDKYGQPTTSYAIDGETVGTYTAPFTPDLHTGWNTTFFSKRDLSPETHEVVVTNTNGTSPNVFWLDYFLVDVDQASPNNPPTSAPPPTSVPTTLSQGSLTMAATDATTTNGSTSTAAGAGRTRGHPDYLATVVGAVGGVILLTLLVALFSLWRRRKQRSQDDIDPFPLSNGRQTSYSDTQASQSTPTRAADISAKAPTSTTALLFPTTVARTPGFSSNHSSSNDVSAVATDSLPAALVWPSNHSTMSPRCRSAVDGDLQDSIYTTPSTQPPTFHSKSDIDIGYSHVLLSPQPVSAARAPWSALPQSGPRAQSLLGALSLRIESGTRLPERDMDSGLRLYNDVALPPAYTPD
ncbi:hypothetical protein DICSQDRAFT_146415 [Dichomitus squalens LYAD-421 SS1]|uniref:Uncharacterized protein n=1 Tax=Dichomitus squalens (strain LYAD-421) TaxID=732165 RepID=R7T193_DICSQ|nr:uncharacterized protein DICSQDRAFT_146415 [Dichomitus squalens LYAD-421 SS1]EJF62126.1 hypothetical protein DICSQDRAFT_146415 [Dichomitus squalens LYAD-421 SS1]